MHARYMVRCLTQSAPFMDYICIFCPVESNQQDVLASLTTKMMIILVCHVQMQDFKKKVRAGIIPHLLRRWKVQGL